MKPSDSLLAAIKGDDIEAIVVSKDLYAALLDEFPKDKYDPNAKAPYTGFMGSFLGLQIYQSDLLPSMSAFPIRRGDRLGLANPILAAEQAVKKTLKPPGPYADIKYIDPRTYRAYSQDKEFILDLDPMGAKQMVEQYPGIEWKEIGP